MSFWEWLLQLVFGGIAGKLINWWSTYRQGVNAQKLEEHARVIEKERQIYEALKDARPERPVVTDDWLRRGGNKHQAASRPTDPPPSPSRSNLYDSS